MLLSHQGDPNRQNIKIQPLIVIKRPTHFWGQEKKSQWRTCLFFLKIIPMIAHMHIRSESDETFFSMKLFNKRKL